MHTIDEARAYLRKNYAEGVECPCCGQFVKLYKRQIYVSMAADLIKLYRLHRRYGRDRWFHISEIRKSTAGGGDFAKFLHWGLIEEAKKDPEETTTRTSGYWRITLKGEAFVERRLTVQKYVMLYNGKFRGFDGPQVDIRNRLGKKFNYEELFNEPLNL